MKTKPPSYPRIDLTGLVSDAADLVTGTALLIDGGWTAQ